MSLAPGAQHRWAPPTVEASHTDATSTVLAGGADTEPVVSSTLGAGEATTVPVTAGSVTYSVASRSQVAVRLTVPRLADGRDWCPGTDAAHPLARYGQTLSVAMRVSGGPVDEVHQLATARIEDWVLSRDGGSVEVTALGPLKGLETAGWAVPKAAAPGGTYASEAVRLAGGLAPVVIDDALVDRAVPALTPWGDERLTALEDLATAWPARIRTDPYGAVWFLPPLGEVPVPQVRLADGQGGTVVSAPLSDTRDSVPNRVIARGEDQGEDRPAVYGWAEIGSGPMRVAGPYGYVVAYYSSPLLTTRGECTQAAVTRLRSLSRRSRTVPVECAPDPRIRLDMPAEVLFDGDRHWGWVVGYELPLVVGSGPMRVDVEVPS